jgi:hypothetical protein
MQEQKAFYMPKKSLAASSIGFEAVAPKKSFFASSALLAIRLFFGRGHAHRSLTPSKLS